MDDNQCSMRHSGWVSLGNFLSPVALGKNRCIYLQLRLIEIKCGLCLRRRVISNISSLYRNRIGFNDGEIWRCCCAICYFVANNCCMATTRYMNAFKYLLSHRKMVKCYTLMCAIIIWNACQVGVFTIVAGLLTLKLPETLNVPIPQTIQEAEMKSKPNQSQIANEVSISEL